MRRQSREKTGRSMTRHTLPELSFGSVCRTLCCMYMNQLKDQTPTQQESVLSGTGYALPARALKAH